MSTHLLRASVLLATTATAACTATMSPGPVGPRPYAGGPVAASGPAPAPAPPPGAPAPAPVVACADPDQRDFPDDVDRPTPIAPDSTTVGCLVNQDKDLFLVTVPPSAAGTLLTFRISGDGGVAPVLEVLDGNRRRLVNQYVQRREEGRGWVAVAGGTSVYLRVGENVVRGSGVYTLQVASAPIVDATEPASSAETALALPLGKPVQGVMSRLANQRREESEDWFVVDVPAAGPLVIELDMSPGVRPHVYLLDGNRRQLRSEHGDPGERVVLEREVKAAGRYYVRVTSSGGVDEAKTGEVPESFTRPYVLTVRR